MGKFRKKPVVIEAVPVSEVVRCFENEWQGLPSWVEDAYEEGLIVAVAATGLTVRTLEGNLAAGLEDMLIRGVKGELYPCKPDIFAATYDDADSDDVNTGLPVKGYVAQSDKKVALVNANKELEERVLRQFDVMQLHNLSSDDKYDERMMALARTKVQEAFMWLNRAVFQPTRVSLPEDEN